MSEETRLKVIVADDEPIVCMDISAVLTSLNYDVKGVASDGFDAVELCKRERPDIAIIDVKMPLFDGLSAVKEILSNNYAVAAVLMTAYSDNDLVKRATDLGVTGYLVKPVDEKSIKPTLEVAYSARKSILEKVGLAEAADKKLRDKNTIDRAKFIVSKRDGISEGEAFRLIQQSAMDKRISMTELAEVIMKASKPL